MNFNYRDFFIHNDDLHIIKEQLSIVDETGYVPQENALEPNAEAVWNMYAKGGELDNEKIAENLGINVDTVKKIIDICEKKFLENKTVPEIANEMKLADNTIMDVLNNAIPDWERAQDRHFTEDAEEIYDLYKSGINKSGIKEPEKIVNLINQNRKPYLQIKLDKVNLVLTIVDIATKQMENDGVTNTREIERQINHTINFNTISKLIKKLGIGEIRYRHKFTTEQDAFILYSYLQRIGSTETARQFNMKFSTDSNELNIGDGAIYARIKNTILKSKSESEISEYALKLLSIYKDKYFSTVDINNDNTKNLLTHYTPSKTVGGRDRTGTGTNRDMSAHLGTLPKNFNTMVTNLRNAHTIR
jgi:predicted Ser/Thr protein kinase